MKKLFGLLLLNLFLVTNSFAASGSANVSSIAGYGGGLTTSAVQYNNPNSVALADLTNVKTLISYNLSGVSTDYYGFWNQNSPSSHTQYQVPSTKTFHVTSLCSAMAANGAFNLGYATSPFAEGAASVTGEISYSPSTTAYPFNQSVVFPLTQCYNVGMSFPPNSYPFLRIGGNFTFEVFMVGREL
jgi:hypothetical protein